MAKEVSFKKVRLLKAASGMLRFGLLVSVAGGGRMGPGGGHRDRTVGMRKESVLIVGASIVIGAQGDRKVDEWEERL
jgi:5-formyltetrahydrofolate cyclo-ligase